MSVVSTFIHLEGQDKKLIIKTLLLGYRIRFMTWIYSFPRLQQIIKKMGKDNRHELDLYKIIWAVQATSPYVLRSTCLTNALTAQVLLSRNEYPSTLRIGVNKDADFEAHAWLELDGVVIVGGSEKEYKPLVEL